MKNLNRGQVMFWVVFTIAVVGLAALLAGGVSPSVKTKASFYPPPGSGVGFRPPLSEDQDFGQDILEQYRRQGYDVSNLSGYRPEPDQDSLFEEYMLSLQEIFGPDYDISSGVGGGGDDIVIGEPEFPFPPPNTGGSGDGGLDGDIVCFRCQFEDPSAPCYCGGGTDGGGGGQQPGGPGGDPIVGGAGASGCDPEERPLTVTDDKGNQVTRCLVPANPKSKGQIDCENQGMGWEPGEAGSDTGPGTKTCVPLTEGQPAPTGCPSGWMLSREACVLDPSGASGDRRDCRDAWGDVIPGMWLVDDGKNTGTPPICVIS